MNLHQRGADIINQLKAHVLEVLETHPDGQPKDKVVLQRKLPDGPDSIRWERVNWIIRVMRSSDCCTKTARSNRQNHRRRRTKTVYGDSGYDRLYPRYEGGYNNMGKGMSRCIASSEPSGGVTIVEAMCGIYETAFPQSVR